eukprot:5838227-Alexandrium_andersonii.AAC.1
MQASASQPAVVETVAVDMDADEPDEVRELQEMAARLEKIGMCEQAEAVTARVNEILQKRDRELGD